MDDPYNLGTCCYEGLGPYAEQCVVCNSPQINNPDKPSECCDQDSDNIGSCQNRGTFVD